MIMRRIRTLTDRFLQPPPAPGSSENDRYYERRLNELSALIDPPGDTPSDARLDFEKWGSWLQGGTVVRSTNANVAVETMAEAILRWKNEYLPGRRTYIYGSQVVGRGGEIPLSQTGGGPTTNFSALVVKGAPVKVLVPAGGSLGTTWTGDPRFEPFAATGWRSGVTGVGYERGAGYEALIGTDVNDAMRNNNSVYLRIEFNVSDPAAFDSLQLRMQYDDGFVAYLNGTFLVSANAPAVPQWNSAATVSREANPTALTPFDVTDKRSLLRVGRNVLAIHGLNDNVNSSDMIIVPELHGGKVTPASTLEPKIDFGAIDISPASGNQDEEFIQLINPHATAVDISDWRLTGGVEHTFPGGTVLPPRGALYVVPNAAAFRARKVSPKGGERLLVQDGYQGHLSNFGETLWLVDASGGTNNVSTYAGQPSDPQRYLVISEVLYHPSGDDLAEFIELMNISPSVTLNLNGVRFTEGVQFDFTGSAITSLPPGGRVLVVRDRAVFSALYGTNLPVAGVFQGGSALNNGGDRIKLEDVDDGTIQEFAYDDQPPWPTEADAGYSLVLVAPETKPDPALPENWRASRRLGGSPGRGDVPGFPLQPEGDADGNGEPDLLDYALGNDLGLAPIRPRLAWQPKPWTGSPELWWIYPVSVGADRAQLGTMISTNLTTWQDGTPHLEPVSQTPLGDGRDLVTWRIRPSLRDVPRVLMRLRAVER